MKLAEIYKTLLTLPSDTVIGEFAGRDSVAAILKALEDDTINHILPIATFAPTEYGDFRILESNFNRMRNRVQAIYGDKKRIFPLVYYNNFDLWSVINGRLTDYLLKKFGFYTPCIGCHAYFHLVRIPIALKLGKRIIAGERESHDGRLKINQSAEALNSYKKIASHFAVDLLMPIRNWDNGDEVEQLIGWNWEEGEAHQTCAYNGNYSDIDGTVLYAKEKITAYLNEFLFPVCISLGNLLANNPGASKKQMLDELKKRGCLL